MRDNQRSAVYRWEHGLPRGRRFVHLDECQVFINEVWDVHGAKGRPPKVFNWRGAKGRSNRWEIHLPKVTRFESYMLHEITHSILHYTPNIADHGPTFTSFYVALLEEYGVIASAQREKERGWLQRPRKVRFL